MPKEYIEREALIRYTEKQEVIIKDGTSVADAMRIQGNVFRRCVETCSTADVAEVIRCGECVYSKERKIKDTVICSKYNAYKDINGFCDAGEKKKDG